MNKIKKGDKVQIMRGKEAGKTGEIFAVIVNTQGKATKVIIKGMNVVKRAQKANPQFGIAGGIVEKEKGIDISNVMVLDPKTQKPSRIGFKMEGGKKVRFSKDSGEILG